MNGFYKTTMKLKKKNKKKTITCTLKGSFESNYPYEVHILDTIRMTMQKQSDTRTCIWPTIKSKTIHAATKKLQVKNRH